MGTPVRKKTLEKNPPTDGQQQATSRFYCSRCGCAHSRQKGFFPVSHSPMYRASGYLPWCNDCIEEMYDSYRSALGDDRAAMRRMCMKMDLYWHDSIYDMVERTSGVNSRVRSYIGKTNIVRYIDKTYDDTIRDEERASVIQPSTETAVAAAGDCIDNDVAPDDDIEISDDVRLFWGPGYTSKMYSELEDRRKYWLSRFPDGYTMSVGEEALIRQICNLEIDINHDRAAGKPIDKSANTLNTLLGSLNVKPTQQKDEIDASLVNTPLGVWLYRYENKRPLPEVDEELQDVNGLKRYIFTWMGHLCKMCGIKNGYTRLYEEEIARLRVDRPEYEDDDEESLLIDSYSENYDGDES